jgi:hypothetical protein
MPLSLTEQLNIAMSSVTTGEMDNLSKMLTSPESLTLEGREDYLVLLSISCLIP